MMAESVPRQKHLIANAGDVPDQEGVILPKARFLNKNRNLPCIAGSKRAVTGAGAGESMSKQFQNFQESLKIVSN